MPENFLNDPDGLLAGRIPEDRRRTCRNEGDCIAAARDLDGDSVAEWLVASEQSLVVYQETNNGWREIGGYEVNACRPRQQDARELLRGGLTLAPSPLPDLTVGDTLIPLTRRPDCPA